MMISGGSPNYRAPQLTDLVEIRPASGGPWAVCTLADLQALFGDSEMGLIGPYMAVPAPSANGTPLCVLPAGATRIRFYFEPGDSVTTTIASSQPGSAPTLTRTFSFTNQGPNWDEILTGQMIYVTAVNGSPIFRY